MDSGLALRAPRNDERSCMTNPVLDINNLVVSIGKKPKGANIIDGISIQVHERETLCLVGESGSGKSVTSLTTMGLLPKGTLVPTAGSVKLVGEELLTATDRRLRQLRATQMAMIFAAPGFLPMETTRLLMSRTMSFIT